LLEIEVSDVRGLYERDGGAWQRVRAEVVLNVMLDVLETTVAIQKRVPSLPLLLLEVLRMVACRVGENPFEAAKRPAWIYWDRPQGCEWLASSILLWGAPDAFFDLRPELRLAMLEKLPRTNEQVNEQGISFQPVVRALSRGAERLTDPEMAAVQQWLKTAESGGLFDLWRADLLTGLFASRADAEAAANLRELAVVDTLRAARAELVAGYIEAASSPKVVGMEATVVELLEAIFRAEADPPIQAGMGLALARPHRERVLELLRAVLRLEILSQEVRGVLEAAIARDGESREQEVDA
jgi:hypothetical protein